MRGTISREHPWEVMPDLYFYRDPEEVCSAPWEMYPCFLFFALNNACAYFKHRLRRRSRLQLRRLLERRSSRVNGVLLQLSSPSLRWLTGLRVLLCPQCPSSSSRQVHLLVSNFNTSSLFRNCKEIVVPNLSLNFCFYFLTAAPAVKTGEVLFFLYWSVSNECELIHYSNIFFFLSPLQRTGALSLPQRIGPLPPLLRHLTGVVPLLTGLKSPTLASIKVFTLELVLLIHLKCTEGH